MAEFHNIKVADIYKETKDCVVISFDVPDALKEKFKFRQGQHLTLRKELNGEDIRRNYSLCSSPLDGEWKVAVKTIRDGVFSNYAFNDLKIGDTLEVMAPHGEFTVDVNVEASNNYIAFAAGSGITPLLSIIKTHLHEEPNSTFKLFYLNRTVKSIIFKEEIEQLKNEFFDRFQVFYFLTKEQRDIPFLNGRFDKEKLAVLTKNRPGLNDATPFGIVLSVCKLLVRDCLVKKLLRSWPFDVVSQSSGQDVREQGYCFRARLRITNWTTAGMSFTMHIV